MPTPPRPDTSAHMTAKCDACGAAFVVLTRPPGGLPLEIASARMQAAVCPDCAGSCLTYGLGPVHDAAVARLRRDAALD